MKRILLSAATAFAALHVGAAIPPSPSTATCAALNDHSVTVAVFSLNDFHAALLTDLRRGVPGAANVVETLDSLKRCYPHHITVSAGDNFGGSFFYTATRHESLLPQAFADMGITHSAVGNHEWDDGQESTAERWQNGRLTPRGWTLQYVSANVRQADGRQPDYIIPAFTQQVMLDPQRPEKTVGIRFIGLTTSNTPFQASARRLKGLTFDGRYDQVLDSVARLDEDGPVHARILLTHIGTQMRQGLPVWDDRDSTTLLGLGPQRFDAILTAHSHSHVIGQSPTLRPVPLVQGLCYGHYISILKCRIDTASMQLLDITPELVRVGFHERLSPHAARLQAQLEEQYHTTLFRGEPLSRVLSHTSTGIAHNRKDNTRQCRMGSLVCESYAQAYRQAAAAQGVPTHPNEPVIGVSHFGSIRAGFPAGDVTVLDVGEALPFANPLRAYHYTGQQLRALMEHGINVCTLGRIQTSGVQVVQDKRGRVTQLSLSLPSGKVVPIHDKTKLILVADDYMTTGGDGYLPDQFPKSAEITISMAASTDAFISYLKTLPTL